MKIYEMPLRVAIWAAVDIKFNSELLVMLSNRAFHNDGNVLCIVQHGSH